jgi:hypothetical protein
VVVDFHVNDVNSVSAKKFTATHKKGHTFDLILTRSDDKFVSGVNVTDPAISDHLAVNYKLLFAKTTNL